MLKMLKAKPMKLRKVGERGIVAGIPTTFCDRNGLTFGSEFIATTDDHGNLVLVFKNSIDYSELKKKGDSLKR